MKRSPSPWLRRFFRALFVLSNVVGPLLLVLMLYRGRLPEWLSDKLPSEPGSVLALLAAAWVAPAFVATVAMPIDRRRGLVADRQGEHALAFAWSFCSAVTIAGLYLLLAEIGRLDADLNLTGLISTWNEWSEVPYLRTPRWMWALWALADAIGRVAIVVFLGWKSLPEKLRVWFWIITDTALLAGTVYAFWRLPFRVSSGTPQEIALVAQALGVTSACLVRLFLRALTPTSLLLERFGFGIRIAVRMLRAKKSGFLTAIGLLSVLAVSFSSCTLSTTLSVMGGFRDDLRAKIVGNNPHIIVDREQGHLETWEVLRQELLQNPNVRAVTPFVSGDVMLSSASNNASVMLQGIEVESADPVLHLSEHLVEGSLEAPPVEPAAVVSPETSAALEAASDILNERAHGAQTPRNNEGLWSATQNLFGAPSRAAAPRINRPWIILGRELAHTLRLHVGDDVSVLSPYGDLGPTGPMPRIRTYRVSAIYQSGNFEYDTNRAFIGLGSAQRFFSTGDAITGLGVQVRSWDDADDVAAQLVPRYRGRHLRIRAWQELNRNLFGALALEKLAMFITLGIAILVASFCILGTLTLMVQEKSQEVGILLAMGSSAAQIRSVFIWQGLLIGLIGASSGLGLGYLLCFGIERLGLIPLSAEIYYTDHLPVHVDPMEFLSIGIAALSISLLATIYPAILSSKLKPLEALQRI